MLATLMTGMEIKAVATWDREGSVGVVLGLCWGQVFGNPANKACRSSGR
jgi:hypothetical protein